MKTSNTFGINKPELKGNMSKYFEDKETIAVTDKSQERKGYMENAEVLSDMSDLLIGIDDIKE